jgi:uncharacterized membrane protein YdjX (TVP38/TMEM64 family)
MSPRRATLLRLALLAALLAGALVAAEATGLRARLTLANVRALAAGAGAWGAALFVAVFCIGEFVQVPGMLFVSASIVVWGRVWGTALAWVAAVTSVAFTFMIVRAVGGRALAAVERPLVKRLLDGIEAHPVRTVFVLRVLFQVSPPLNYGFALTPIRFRDYLVGSAIGLAVPVLAAALFLDRLLAHLGARP